MQDLKTLQQSLPEAVNKKLLDEAEFIRKTFGLDDAQAGIVEKALFKGAMTMKEEMTDARSQG